MLTVIVLAAAVVCAIWGICSRVSLMALLRFMDGKGYAFPTDAEMKECCREATERMFKVRPTGKGTH